MSCNHVNSYAERRGLTTHSTSRNTRDSNQSSEKRVSENFSILEHQVGIDQYETCTGLVSPHFRDHMCITCCTSPSFHTRSARLHYGSHDRAESRDRVKNNSLRATSTGI